MNAYELMIIIDIFIISHYLQFIKFVLLITQLKHEKIN